jgi:hypothetical protein
MTIHVPTLTSLMNSSAHWFKSHNCISFFGVWHYQSVYISTVYISKPKELSHVEHFTKDVKCHESYHIIVSRLIWKALGEFIALVSKRHYSFLTLLFFSSRCLASHKHKNSICWDRTLRVSRLAAERAQTPKQIISRNDPLIILN